MNEQGNLKLRSITPWSHTHEEHFHPTRFTGDDVVRHPLVARIVKAYDAEYERREAARQPGLKS